MKKKILKNLLVLCFAFGGIYLVIDNVKPASASGPVDIKPMGRYCTWGIQNVGGTSVAVYCHECFPRIGYQGTGTSGECF
jgi:hypothetical protein